MKGGTQSPPFADVNLPPNGTHSLLGEQREIFNGCEKTTFSTAVEVKSGSEFNQLFPNGNIYLNVTLCTGPVSIWGTMGTVFFFFVFFFFLFNLEKILMINAKECRSWFDSTAYDPGLHSSPRFYFWDAGNWWVNQNTSDLRRCP